jgi:pimeloyl-[acyl-carrier protein] methyl ester esterase
MRLILLPGLDGTGILLGDFTKRLPASWNPLVCPLPVDGTNYTDLIARLDSTLGVRPDDVLLAESFSGPIATALAARHQVAGLILCNSFVTAPLPRLLLPLARAPLFRFPLPQFAIRHYLTGPDGTDDLVRQVGKCAADVPASVVAGRVRAVLRVDVRHDLAQFRGWISYLRGTADRLISDRSLDTISRVATSKVEVLRVAAPHLLLQVAPEAAYQALLPMLSRLAVA